MIAVGQTWVGEHRIRTVWAVDESTVTYLTTTGQQRTCSLATFTRWARTARLLEPECAT